MKKNEEKYEEVRKKIKKRQEEKKIGWENMLSSRDIQKFIHSFLQNNNVIFHFAFLLFSLLFYLDQEQISLGKLHDYLWYLNISNFRDNGIIVGVIVFEYTRKFSSGLLGMLFFATV